MGMGISGVQMQNINRILEAARERNGLSSAANQSNRTTAAEPLPFADALKKLSSLASAPAQTASPEKVVKPAVFPKIEKPAEGVLPKKIKGNFIDVMA
jgi:hypothetical protein